MTWEKMKLTERIEAVHLDCMRSPVFCAVSGIIVMGKWSIDPSIPTAGTDGLNCFYGDAFIAPLNRKKLRYLVLHEQFHKLLKHCTLPRYRKLVKDYPRETNAAQDYVINGLIEEMDPRFAFVERPSPDLLINPDYQGWSFTQVLDDLLKNGKGKGKGKGKPGQQGQGDGDDGLDTLDDHSQHGKGKDGKELSDEDVIKINKNIDDALRQGEITKRRLAGNGKGGRDVFGLNKASQTNWREATREWIQSICVGDDQSRFTPRNKNYVPHGLIMPTHFSERTGDIIVACDTSGSMGPHYGMLFGEIAKICKDVLPDSVRIVWWDTSVCGEQLFDGGPHGQGYEGIATLLKPKGGGGTTPAVVPQYIAEKQYKPTAVIVLTDGEFFGDAPAVFSVPTLWGVINNERFTPPQGKVLHIRGE